MEPRQPVQVLLAGQLLPLQRAGALDAAETLAARPQDGSQLVQPPQELRLGSELALVGGHRVTACRGRLEPSHSPR